MVICETKTNNTKINDLYKIKSYLPFHKNRHIKNGGGVAILIRNRIRAEQIQIPINIEEEIVGVNIKIGPKTCSFFAYYNLPNKKINKKVFEFVEKLHDFLLIGDLNSRIPKFEERTNSNGISLIKILEESSGQVLNKKKDHTYSMKKMEKRSLLLSISLLAHHYLQAR